ncbi:chloride channel protein [Sphingomonas sp. GB1N7]|uniref:chloride channel protein n=1 Tax=Parasphingomonas caseinilytica TaxID=3096158 RepID=UPI002FC8337C
MPAFSTYRAWLQKLVEGRTNKAHGAVALFNRRFATGAGAVLLGLAALVFAKLGDVSQMLFGRLVASWPYAPLLLTPVTFGLVAYVTARWAPEARGSGIPQVIAASRDPGGKSGGPLVSLRTAAAKIAMTLAILGAGGAVGREGPTVQLSAAIMVACHRLLRVPVTAGVLIAGGAAGVAAAFNTPLAGVAFAIEELASAYEQKVAVLVMVAVMIAGMVSLGIAGDYVYFGTMRQTLALGSVLVVAPAAGVLGGLAGGLFTRIVLAVATPTRGRLVRAKRRPVMIACLCGAVVAILGLVSNGATWGTGFEATRQLVEGHYEPLWFGLAKFVSALMATLSGAPGGVFAPSLAVGAGFGNLLTAAFPDDPAGAVVLLGMIAYFVGVVRAPLTAVIIISETTASRGMIIPLFATALIADVVSAMICKERLYHGLAKPFLQPTPANVETDAI